MSNVAIALLEPEIPPNTGNIARLCAATETPLHLIGRLGFHINDKTVRRAGLDYWPWVPLYRQASFDLFAKEHLSGDSARLVCFSAHAQQHYTQFAFQPGDILLFGCESRGLPADILDTYRETALTIPMISEHVRSLNLSTSVGIALYEALRQLHQW